MRPRAIRRRRDLPCEAPHSHRVREARAGERTDALQGGPLTLNVHRPTKHSSPRLRPQGAKDAATHQDGGQDPGQESPIPLMQRRPCHAPSGRLQRAKLLTRPVWPQRRESQADQCRLGKRPLALRPVQAVRSPVIVHDDLVDHDDRPTQGSLQHEGLRPPSAPRGPLDVRRRLHRVEHPLRAIAGRCTTASSRGVLCGQLP